MNLATAILIIVSLQRIGELFLSNHNTRRLLEQNATESGARHYPLLVGLHTAWLSALWIWGYDQPVNLAWLSLFAVLQCLRVWIIATLGPRWTTRIIITPDPALVARGPYRWVNHPNYVVVALEIVVLPLTLGLPSIALIFTILNAVVLTVRIRAEDRALQHQRNWRSDGLNN